MHIVAWGHFSSLRELRDHSCCSIILAIAEIEETDIALSDISDQPIKHGMYVIKLHFTSL